MGGIVFLEKNTGNITKTLTPDKMGSCSYSETDAFPIIYQRASVINDYLYISGICNCQDQPGMWLFECTTFVVRYALGINTFVELHENKRDYIDSFPGVYNMALLTDVISLDEETIYFAEAWYPTDDTL